MQQKIKSYINKWKTQGYQEGIPDEVPNVLMKQGLAPSYKAIALAILKNDHNMEDLGFTPKVSRWYSAFKQVEIAARNATTETQGNLKKSKVLPKTVED